MSSIGSTVNSINSSLLSEINSYLQTSKTSSSASVTGTDTSTGSSSTDRIDFSQVGQLFKDLQQLQQSISQKEFERSSRR